MRLIIQRVKHASCTINQKVYSSIQEGYMILVGIETNDTKEIVAKMSKKAMDLRIFDDQDGKMNLSIEDIKGSVLSISQFTLYADCRKGRRPGFEQAAKPEISKPLYEYFNDCIKERGTIVNTGVFGADMKIDLLNDGPVTIILDSSVIC